MKGRWLLVGMLLVATCAPATQADSAAFHDAVLKAPGLVGYWPFDGGYQDVSGNGNNAVAHNGTSPAITFVTGVNGGQAVHIDNANQDQWVSVPAPIGSIFDQPQFTLTSFIRLTKAADEGSWNDLFDRNSLWYMELQSETVNGQLLSQFVIRIYDPANPGSNGSGQIRDSAGAAFVKTNDWHQYTMSYDGHILSGYLDGKLALLDFWSGGVGPTAATPTMSPNNNYDLDWGAFEQNGDWFTGDVDDSAYFKRALTADEVKGLYDAMMAKKQ